MRRAAYVLAGVLALAACRDFGRFEAIGAEGGAASGGDQMGGGGAVSNGGSGGSTTASGGGGSGGGALECGKMALAATDFADASDPRFRTWTENGNTSVSIAGGELVFSSAGAGEGALRSNFAYDLTDSEVSIELTQVPAAGNKGIWFVVFLLSEWVEIYVFDGKMQANRYIDDSLSIITEVAHDPVQHRFLRLRETGGTFFWEAGPDGSTWEEIAQQSTSQLFDMRHAFVEVGLYDEDGDGAGAVDNLRGGSSTGPLCSSELLVDDYDTQGTLPPAWTTGVENGCGAYSWDGEIHLEVDANMSGTCFRASSNLYDVRNTATEIEAYNTPTPSSGVANVMLWTDLDGDAVGVGFMDDELHYATTVAGGSLNLVPVGATLSSGWARIVIDESSATVESSSDGVSWMTHYSDMLPSAFDASSAFGVVGAETITSPLFYEDTHYDNFNLPP